MKKLILGLLVIIMTMTNTNVAYAKDYQWLLNSDVEAEFGELEELFALDGVLYVTVKTKSSWNDKLTVEQNFYNIQHFIEEYGYDKYDAIDYAAYMDFINIKTGKTVENKAVQFTVSHEIMELMKEEKILPNELAMVLDDL